jgi:hypothetical protein
MAPQSPSRCFDAGRAYRVLFCWQSYRLFYTLVFLACICHANVQNVGVSMSGGLLTALIRFFILMWDMLLRIGLLDDVPRR